LKRILGTIGNNPFFSFFRKIYERGFNQLIVVEEINISKVPVKKITFDETNPNILTDEQMKSLKKTMEKFGFLAPVILNKDLQVIDGEHRVRIYQELGKKTIQAYVIDVNTINKKMLRQLMNKLRGEHDKQKDAEEFKLIFEAGKLNEFSELLATQAEEFQTVLEKKFDIGFEKAEEQEIPETPTKPKAKVGDIYQLGKHRIMCGDCMSDFDKLFGEKKVDMLLTDPPYGVDYAGKNEFLNKIDKGSRIQKEIENDNIDSYLDFFTNFLKVINFSEYNNSYIFMSGLELHNVRLAMENVGMKWSDYLVWVKNNHVLSRKDYNPKHEFVVYGWKNHHKFYSDSETTILEFDKRHINDLHPTMKPIDLLCKLIKNGSQSSMLIYDPFLGSGSTIIACEDTDRVCYGLEIDPAYIDVIIERWENHTGKKAKKL